MPLSSASPDPPSASPTGSAEGTHGAADKPYGAADRTNGAAEGTYYQLLRMPATATEQQLRQAFRRLSKCYHPDTTTLPAAEAARAFQQLQRAYAVLSDPAARRLYDERLRLSHGLPAARSASPGAAPRPTADGPLAGATLRSGAPVSLRRALSGGEWFALLLLALALALSLVVGIGVAWARGAEMMRWPSWWTDLHPTAAPLASASPPAAGSPPPTAAPEADAPLFAP
ncbi:MAG: J domain-containing protein [Cyanobacteriota bacterium]|nr:J domain-containing protein [Cyanobacteriota bacterium]